MKASTAERKDSKAAITIDELIAKYELSNRVDGKSESTIRWYGDILGSFSNHIKDNEHCQEVCCFNIDIVRRYVLHLRSRPKFRGHPYTPEQDELVSPRTVQCHVRALKAFSSWLYGEGYTEENRLRNLKLPKAPTKMIEPLTPEEINRVIASINRDSPTRLRNHAILVTALDTGTRASEIAGITLGQLNLENGFIKVMGKGSRERIAPIGKFVQRTLWQYVDQVRPELVAGDWDRLFLSRSGQPITVNTIKLVFSRLAKKSGVQRLHAHLCRHTFAINYLLNGGDIFSLQQILGHATLEMVRHYLHFTSSQITAQQHKYSPMDKLHEIETRAH